MNNKRRWKYDNGESLVSQMDQLSIKQVNSFDLHVLFFYLNILED
jgi:hypothetical protein